MSARRAAITGVAGQDGSYLAELLLEQGYEVVGLDRAQALEGSPNLAGVRGHAELVAFELLDHDGTREALLATGASELYHLAAPTFVPELKIPVASARSRFGNHSATALIEAGKLPASPSPSANRARLNPATDPARVTNAKPVVESSVNEGMLGPL